MQKPWEAEVEAIFLHPSQLWLKKQSGSTMSLTWKIDQSHQTEEKWGPEDRWLLLFLSDTSFHIHFVFLTKKQSPLVEYEWNRTLLVGQFEISKSNEAFERIWLELKLAWRFHLVWTRQMSLFLANIISGKQGSYRVLRMINGCPSKN